MEASALAMRSVFCGEKRRWMKAVREWKPVVYE